VKSPDRQIETMQIGMTASRKHMSGTDRYYHELLQALPACGIGVRGMVLGEPGALEPPMSGVASFAPEGSGRLARVRGARRTARPLLAGADLVVSHGPPHAFYVLDLLGARPLVAHFHGPWALEGRAEGVGRFTETVRHVQEAAVYRRARRFIVLSRAYGATLEGEFGVDPACVRVIPGGVDLRRFSLTASPAEARARLGWPLDRPIVVATRRLEPTKGIGPLIDAIALVRASVPSVLCMIAGTGALAESLRARAEAANLGDNVRFLGHIASAELAFMYRAADLSVVPSAVWEGFGLSVVESLACGTPALVTPVGGLPEVVQPLSSELVVRDPSPPAIAEGLVRALADRHALPDREACIAHARLFDWSAIAERVAAVYREVA
jgi:glycosyltransferase involved in cell wall biosynthesis